MFCYSRCVFLVAFLVTLLQFSDSLLENVTVVECEKNKCTISCYLGNDPFTWKYIPSFKDPWKVLDQYNTQTITVKGDMIGYYHCIDKMNNPSKIFYFVGKKASKQPSSSAGLTAAIVLAVLFGIGFFIMVALGIFMFNKRRASLAVADGVTIRQRASNEVCQTVRQSSVDDDGYIVPLPSENRDSDYLEVLCPPGLSNNSTRTPSCGHLYENLENIRKTRASSNWH